MERDLEELWTLYTLLMGDFAPRPALRELLLEAVTVEAEQLGPFVERVAVVLDLTLRTATRTLASLKDESLWDYPYGPEIGLLHVKSGSRLAGAQAGFVRLAPGAALPRHQHGGVERMLMLQGSVVDDFDGREIFAGESCERGRRTTHSVRNSQEQIALFLVVVSEEVKVQRQP